MKDIKTQICYYFGFSDRCCDCARARVFLLLLCLSSAFTSIDVVASPAPAAFQQTGVLTVTVRDNQGPLIGANVLVKGTSNGGITDVNGAIQLSNVDSTSEIEVSYIGYQSQTVPVSGQTHLTVVLKEDTQTLDDVVIVGYGTLEKKKVTSAITSLSSSDMIKGLGGSDISQSLKGKVSGLLLQNNG